MIRLCFSVRAAACALACWTASAVLGWSGQILFQTDFSNDSLNALPSQADIGSWSFSAGNNHQAGAVSVQADGEEWFGRGSANQFLRVRDSQHMNLRAELSGGAEVITTSFEFIGRNTPNDSRWLNITYYAEGSTARQYIFALNLISRIIRSTTPLAGYGPNDQVLRFDVILNNSANSISYDTPGGGTATLASNRTAVWANGSMLVSEYKGYREASGAAAINSIHFITDSAAVVSFDLDNFNVRAGAHVLADPPPLPVIPMVTAGDDGRLVYTQDARGNRIPDFSNAGYMGGGVPIPEDVPTRVTLSPQPGDDTQRIQSAINAVSAMPMDANGFRGAVLLRQGEYAIGGQLRITAGGVVLRGEGDGTDGTVLNATGTSQRTLIEIAGSGSWSTVANTTRTIIDDYVPVGARSFHVTDASPFRVGDTVLVHRPSTAEWISAIGMDQIPPRNDGLPVTQWAPGAYDIRYDRIITAVEGNRLTVDAPIVNSLDQQFGGGWIYRYTFNNRISQVGVEDIRGFSVNQGGTDEDHSWRFITVTAAQNVWVRRTTAVAFSFGNTLINSTAKWVTVEDSQMLDPVSQITGSRRYPFYISGQLCLVQRCYARNARHDYSTNSRTHGPNVFLDSAATQSHSDSGPHHRWATGTLYDNLDLPDADLNVQNRLNFGSGHGWAGANHVVWNSRVRRAAIQNPPTAQNWAVGVIGSRWAGSFPEFAPEEAYWISQNETVAPQSLYLAQLKERLGEDGPGGLITFLRLTGSSALTPAPGAPAAFGVQRSGVRDRGLSVRFELTGGLEELVDREALEASLFMPAHQNSASFVLGLRENAFIPEDRNGTLALRHGPGYSAQAVPVLPVFIAARSGDTWLATHFSEEERANPAVSGDLASPAGDRVPNLLKYALGLNPRKPFQAGDLPVLRRENDGVEFTFRRRAEETEVEALVEFSSDLRDWQPVGENAATIVTPDVDGWEIVTLRLLSSAAETPARFFRLRVERID